MNLHGFVVVFKRIPYFQEFYIVPYWHIGTQQDILPLGMSHNPQPLPPKAWIFSLPTLTPSRVTCPFLGEESSELPFWLASTVSKL